MAKWWRVNRPSSPDLFDQELEAATRQLERDPALLPIYETVRGRVVRRMLLVKTERHVYYSVDQATQSVVVHVIWAARKGRGPKL
jgi:hypothetical protein